MYNLQSDDYKALGLLLLAFILILFVNAWTNRNIKDKVEHREHL